MPRLLPTITVFSATPEVAECLSLSCNGICSLDIIRDDCLTGYGATIEFEPQNISASTLESLRKAEILISEPALVASLLKHDAGCFESLKWCQSTYAGVDPLFTDPEVVAVAKPWVLTRFAGAFGPPIAEWCLGRIIEHERSFATSAADQKTKDWVGSRRVVTEYRYLSSLTLAVLGCGDIGRCIVKAAACFGMKTIAYGKSRRMARDVDGLDEYTQDLDEALRAGDYVVSVLPSTKETRGLLSGEGLAAAAKTNGGKSPPFLNVGRGDVINEASIVSSLDRGYISAAILDVFETEPLPAKSPLWDKPGVIVSPHISGLTQASDVPKLLLANYRLFVDGEPLMHVVDWNKGY